MMAAFVAISLHFPFDAAYAQEVNDQVTINADGIMHWRENDKEITGFGVNYTTPLPMPTGQLKAGYQSQRCHRSGCVPLHPPGP